MDTNKYGAIGAFIVFMFFVIKWVIGLVAGAEERRTNTQLNQVNDDISKLTEKLAKDKAAYDAAKDKYEKE